jgi:hypothetical protein
MVGAISFQNGAPITSLSSMWWIAMVSEDMGLPGLTNLAPRSSASSQVPSAPLLDILPADLAHVAQTIASRLQVDHPDAWDDAVTHMRSVPPLLIMAFPILQ